MSAWSTGAPDAAMVVASVARSERAMATGTAAVMAAVAVPFAFSDLINVRQFGIGIAVAVLGRRAWWPTASRRAPAGGRTSRLHPRVPGGTT